jgi:hypothetical protein
MAVGRHDGEEELSNLILSDDSSSVLDYQQDGNYSE